MTRNRRAWELSDVTIRFVRNMLLHDDVDSLLETGSGTPSEAALMVRCYELAAMELWDESALIEAATVAGMDDSFTLSGENPESIRRKITIAIKSKSTPEYLPPPEGIKLLCRLGVLVYDELEETVTRFAANGRYDMTAPATDTAPEQDTAATATVVSVGASDGVELLRASAPNAATNPVFSMARTALVSTYLHQWPTIERDLKDAAVNGLSAAKAGKRDWDETKALAWARARGKVKNDSIPADSLRQAMSNMGNLPSRIHKIKG